MLSDRQFGFRKGKGTDAALLEFSNAVYERLNSGEDIRPFYRNQ